MSRICRPKGQVRASVKGRAKEDEQNIQTAGPGGDQSGSARGFNPELNRQMRIKPGRRSGALLPAWRHNRSDLVRPKCIVIQARAAPISSAPTVARSCRRFRRQSGHAFPRRPVDHPEERLNARAAWRRLGGSWQPAAFSESLKRQGFPRSRARRRRSAAEASQTGIPFPESSPTRRPIRRSWFRSSQNQDSHSFAKIPLIGALQ